MTTELQILIAKQILSTGLVAKVYHSCELVRDKIKGNLYPCYKQGSDYHYVGVDDTKLLFAYIRQAGDISADALKVTSCAKSYDLNVPLRIVFFNDHEARDHSYLMTKLSSFTFMNDVRLSRVIYDKFRLARDESDIFRDKMDGKTFYVAFDIFANSVLLHNTCEADECSAYPNPIC